MVQWSFLAMRHDDPGPIFHPPGQPGGEMAVTNRLAKIIQFGAKRRHVRARVTTNGELIRTLILLRPRRDDDDGPRAA